MEDYLRCPHCGVAEGEPIEAEIAVPSLKWTGDIQHVTIRNEVTHEAYFNSVEGVDGDTEYVCSECKCRFKITEV